MDEWTLPEWRFKIGLKPDKKNVMEAFAARARFTAYCKHTLEQIAERGRLARRSYLIERNVLRANVAVLESELGAYLFWRRRRDARL